MTASHQHRSALVLVGFFACLAITLGHTAVAQTVDAEWTVPPVVTATSLPDESTLVTGAFRIPAPRDSVWAVLTDYDHLADFSSGLDTCELLEKKGAHIKIRQTASRQVLFLHKQVTLILNVQEWYPDSIAYMLEEGPFHVYYGAWKLQADAQGTILSNATASRPTFFAPGMIYRSLAQSDTRTVLNDVRGEVYRRYRGNPGFD